MAPHTPPVLPQMPSVGSDSEGSFYGSFPVSCSPMLPFASTPSAHSLASLHDPQVGALGLAAVGRGCCLVTFQPLLRWLLGNAELPSVVGSPRMPFACTPSARSLASLHNTQAAPLPYVSSGQSTEMAHR